MCAHPLDLGRTAYAKVMYGVDLSRNDVIVSVGESEYAANLVAMHQHAKRHGARVRHVAAASSGELDMERLESALKEDGDRVKAVSITHIPTRGGELPVLTFNSSRKLARVIN